MLIREFQIFIRGIIFWLILLVCLSFLFFLSIPASFGFLSILDGRSITVFVFEMLKQDFLPLGVELIVTNPLSAFVTQIMISLSLAFLVSFPFLLYRVTRYLSPVFFEKEKRAVSRVLIPSIILFFSGVIFAYFLIIPSTFKLLYPFAVSLGAVPFFLLNEFIYLVFGIMLSTGLMFLLPVFMVLLSFLGVVRSDFWKDNWRYSFLIFLIFSAIITPDGTGITMAMLLLPLILLYLIGIFFIIKINRSK